MNVKTAIMVLEGVKNRLNENDSEENSVIVEALETIINEINGDKEFEVLYMCDQTKCKECSFPMCEYTTDISHAKSFVESPYGVYIERDMKPKRRKLKDILKEVIRPNENT